MSYSIKKENIKSLARWILDTATNSELNKFHTNEINNRYKKVDSDKFTTKADSIKNRVSERMVYWSRFKILRHQLGFRRVMLRSILVGARPVWHSKEQTVEHHF